MVKTILMVDDESSVRYTVKYGLEQLEKNYKIIDFPTGKNCFEWLEKNPLPDLILLDIMMPEMNGWEIQHKLKENLKWKSIPIIFLTATADDTSKRMGGITAQGFIEKPFIITQLKKKIDEVLKTT